MSSPIPQTAPNAVWRALDKKAVIVSTQSGKVQVLNEVGKTVWQLINGQNSLTRITETVADKYQIPKTLAQQDVTHFVDELAQKGLVFWIGTEQSGKARVS